MVYSRSMLLLPMVQHRKSLSMAETQENETTGDRIFIAPSQTPLFSLTSISQRYIIAPKYSHLMGHAHAHHQEAAHR